MVLELAPGFTEYLERKRSKVTIGYVLTSFATVVALLSLPVGGSCERRILRNSALR